MASLVRWRWAFIAACALAFAGRAAAGARGEVLATLSAWSRAIVANDPRAVGEFVTDGWTLIGADGTVLTKASFLAVVASGDLKHDGLTLDSASVRVYGNTVIVSGIATSTGTYQGRRFETRERSTDVFVKRNGRWRCVLTNLAPLNPR